MTPEVRGTPEPASCRRGFFAGSLRASLPLWLWAAHFAFCYVGVAVGCHAGGHEQALAGLSLLRWMLLLASVLALVLGAFLLHRAWRQAGRGADGGLRARVQCVAAGLALVGIAWTTVPALSLPTCDRAGPDNMATSRQALQAP
jgi:hypothetical protein